MSKESKKIFEGLKERFLDGEKMSAKEMVEEYFSPKTPYNYLIDLKKVKGYVQGIKKSFRVKDGIWFGCLDAEGHYGVATTVDEVRWAVIGYYKIVRGSMINAQVLFKNAKANHILPSGINAEKRLISGPIK